MRPRLYQELPRPRQAAYNYQMTTAEKLSLLDLIWDDLRHNPADLSSPEWHRIELERRGMETLPEFFDWKEAIKRIRQRTVSISSTLNEGCPDCP